MQSVLLGNSPLRSTRLAYGCWRVVGTEDPTQVTDEAMANGRRAIAAAYEAGYTLFDNADIYCGGVCETVLGQAMGEISGMRNRVAIATKCGIRFAGDHGPKSPHRYDSSSGHIVRAAEQSLRRLRIDTIDLYQLHRPDLLMDPHEVAGAFEQLRKQGKAREFGVSNFSPSFVDTLAAFCPMPLIVNQVEIHLGRLDCFYDGTLDQCLRKNMTPMAWSPLGSGWLGSGKIERDDPLARRKSALLETLDDVAADYGVSRTVIALAWLMAHPSKIVPIIGSANPEHIRAATRADEIELKREDWYRLLTAARGEPLP